jgi:hypothetical protein
MMINSIATGANYLAKPADLAPDADIQDRIWLYRLLWAGSSRMDFLTVLQNLLCFFMALVILFCYITSWA